jgi:hypothetical protein
MAAADAKLLVDALQTAFHGTDRQPHIRRDLPAGAACGGLPGGIELAGREERPAVRA